MALAVMQNTIFPFFDVLFQPIVAQGPYLSLAFFSTCLAGIFSIIYWLFLDVERANQIKDKLSEYQDKMKEAQEEGESEKASKHLKKTMKLNQKFMMLNFKPMIGTMVFVALIFPWLGHVYAPNVQLDNATGLQEGQLEYANQTATVIYDNQTLTVDGDEVAVGESVEALGVKWDVSNINEQQGTVNFKANFANLPVSLPLVGDSVNWLLFYILMAMPLTYGFRKALGIQ